MSLRGGEEDGQCGFWNMFGYMKWLNFKLIHVKKNKNKNEKQPPVQLELLERYWVIVTGNGI